jgi:hypothetical protein
MHTLYAQEKFDPYQLKNPKKFGPQIANQLKEKRVYEYKVTPGKHAIFLPNGLRSSSFLDPNVYTRVKDSIFPYRVDIVYSRYPVIDTVYKEFYGLLCNRLIRTFELDPDLNDEEIAFNKVLQTHCETDDQVNTLFHGVVIWYRTPAEEEALSKSKQDSVGFPPKVQNEKEVQGSFKEYTKAIEEAKASELISDSIKQVIAGRPIDVQKTIIAKHLEQEIAKSKPIPLKERTPQEMFMFKRQVTEFLKNNPFSDSVVWRVMNRHPEWSNAIVVNDWTGSMYGYGAQIVHWHLLNYKHSGLRQITLFNDGDRKTQLEKVIGETGGIYSAEASEIPKIINLFNLVRMNGNGGDRPENDVEAILAAIKEKPDATEVILVADNYACIRDIEMAERITKPVKVLVCGYIPEIGINPHLVYLAKATKGGLYTLEEDIENPKVELGNKGELASHNDRRFLVSPMNCTPYSGYEVKFGKDVFKTYTNLDTANMERVKVRKLALNEQGLKEFPKQIIKMKLLYELHLSHNQLKAIPASIKKLENLKDIDFSKNELKALPRTMEQLKGLENVNLSHNHLENLSNFFPSMYYVKYLNASHNQLTQISQINELKTAKIIDLSDNQIEEIPIEIHQLKSLKMLDLSNNQLKALPKTLTGLNKLEELNLENNQLGSLPPYIYRLRKLKVLNLTGNPLSEKEKDRIRKELPLVVISF